MVEKLIGPPLAPSGSPATHEVVRQAAVYASGVLHMVDNPALQQVVERVARHFAVPMAAVRSLIAIASGFPRASG